MDEVIPERVTALRESLGLSQAKLGSRIGTSQASINRIESGETRKPRNLLALARALATSTAYLTGETDEAFTGELPSAELQPSRSSPDAVHIPELNIAFGLGNSYIGDVPVEATMRLFARSWIRQFTPSPFNELYWATGCGPSMTPAILDSDILLIDKAQCTPRMEDQLWAIERSGMGSIKALRPGPNGSMRIISLNPDWPEDVAHDGEMTVLGRVVAIVRKV